MSNFESSVKVIPYSQERVYNKLSDLSNLEAVKDRLPKDKVQDLSFDSDTLSFSVSPIGQLTLQIVERDPCKCISWRQLTLLFLLICGFNWLKLQKKSVK